MKTIINHHCLCKTSRIIGVALLWLGFAPVRAENLFNLVQDNGFKSASAFWVSFNNTDGTGANRANGSFEHLTTLADAPPGLLRFSYFGQDLSKRRVSEIEGVSWRMKYAPAAVDTKAAPYWFGVFVSGFDPSRGICELKYFYRGEGVALSGESGHEKNIVLSMPFGDSMPPPDSFVSERRALKDDWAAAGFSPTAEIVKIKLIGSSMNQPVELKPGGYGQNVWWSDVRVLSTRFDHDIRPLQVLSGNQATIGRSYVPRVRVKNTGAFVETFRIAVTVFKDQVKVFSDTAGGIMLRSVPPDDSREMEFKRWVPKETGNYSIRVATILKQDQNVENDVLDLKLNLVEAKSK